MTVSPTEDIKSVSDLKKHMRAIFDHLHQSGRPVVVTVNGRADVVLLDAAVFEQKLKALNLGHLLAAAETDVRAGRTRPARAFVKSLKRARKLPR